MVDWPRPDVMPHMLKTNLAFILPKRVETKIPWKHAFCTENIVDHVAVSLKTIDYVFPLFIYSDLLAGQKEANINPKVSIILTESLKKEPTPEEVFYYIYSVLYSNVYRTKYEEFLKIEFPRIPFTKNYALFSQMAKLGGQLVDLHLLKSPELSAPISKFQGKGDNKVEKVVFENSRVHINSSQYFEGIKQEVWEYQIGGYQVSAKWLKDRKGRTLSLDDIKHYCQVATALAKTIDIQKEIDKVYPKIEENSIEFNLS
jgi:predicted helicase